MNGIIFKNLLQWSYKLQANESIAFSGIVKFQRYLRQAPRHVEGAVANLQDPSHTQCFQHVESRVVEQKASSLSGSKTPDLFIGRRPKKSQYPSPTPALVPSEKLKQAKMKLDEDILASPDVNILLSFYVTRKKEFELNHYENTLRRLSELCVHGLVPIPELHASQVFQALCYDVWKLTSQIDSSMVLSIYKCLLAIQVDCKSLIMQSLLQMCRHQFNLYSIKELIFLRALLKGTEKCHLKDALELAIPKAIENCIAFHVPANLNFKELGQLLRFCIEEKLKGLNQLVFLIFKKTLPELLLNKKDCQTISKDLVSLLTNLLVLYKVSRDLNSEMRKMANRLVVECLDNLVRDELKVLDKDLTLLILAQLSKYYNKELNDVVYHEEFLSKVVEKGLSEKWDMASLFRIIEYQIPMDYVSEKLMFTVTSNIEEMRFDNTDINIATFVTALASCDLPKETLKKALNFSLMNYRPPLDNIRVPWIRPLLNLLSMKCVDHTLIRHILDEDYLLRHLEFKGKYVRVAGDFADILRLDRYLKSEKEDLTLEVPSRILSMAEAEAETELPTLEIFLADIIGDKRYIASNVKTQQNNLIDHIIILDESGKPVDLSTENLEAVLEISKKDATKMKKFALIEVPESWVMRPGNKLKGSFKLELQLIEREGFVVVPIYEHEVQQLREAFKIVITNKFKSLGIIS